MTLALAFGLFPFVTRTLVYQPWAKVAACVACIAGLTWGVFGILLYGSVVVLSHDRFTALRHVKGLLGLLCVGLVVAILVTRPYRKAATHGG